jgi:D-alanyl-D-alanine carboxypeptidase (penicillin-binding protein 5/6)
VATRVAEISAGPGSGGFQITNDNGLLGRYPGLLGGKTGFTDLARQTYVGVAEHNGRRLVVTLLGAETQPLGSLGEATALLDWGFALPHDAAVGHLVTPEEVSKPSPVAAGVASTRAADLRADARASTSSIVVTGLAVGTAGVLMFLFVVGARRRLVGAHPQTTGRWRRFAPTLNRFGARTRASRSPDREPAPDQGEHQP